MYSLHLINDDVNHHSDVQMALMEVCGLELDEAQSFTLITHVNGSCPIVENIDKEKAIEMKDKLEYLGLQTEITEVGCELP